MHEVLPAIHGDCRYIKSLFTHSSPLPCPAAFRDWNMQQSVLYTGTVTWQADITMGNLPTRAEADLPVHVKLPARV